MLDQVALGTFLPVAFLLVITPGATTAVVVRQALDAGHRAGTITAAGAALGNSSHAAAAALGLSLLSRRSSFVLGAMTLAGACYLAWLGVHSLARAVRAGRTPAPRGIPADETNRSAFTDGLIVTLLNPAALTFYMVVLPGFIHGPDILPGFALLAAVHVTLAFGCHVVWALAFGQVGHLLARPRARQALDAAAGLALIALAVDAVWRAIG